MAVIPTLEFMFTGTAMGGTKWVFMIANRTLFSFGCLVLACVVRNFFLNATCVLLKCLLPTIDPTPMVNVIPSNPSGKFMCCNLAIAIAHGSRGIGGLCQVIQQLRSHLICCADAQKGLSTKTVLIIYDKEDKRVFWESKRDFQAHMLRNGVTYSCRSKPMMPPTVNNTT
ncbi:hypothetical protein [Limnohabitans sp. G3-2]|uniref:hypothetical protein n=1 Tax=Limnohabitans sp. G3-2 TaxID=1100711 RepID=UPI00117A7A23|nr:hypothetical protein [Limnohabitans sp. G3-2]